MPAAKAVSSKTLIVIPAHNEAGQVGELVRQIRRIMSDAHILVVNDASSDGTGQIARDAGACVITHPANLGYGASIQTGYKYAMRQGYHFVVQLDADGQHDPAFIPALLEPVQRGECDVAIGSRFLGEGQYRAPMLRRLGMRLFGSIASWITKQRVTDPTSGYQAINRSALSLYTRDVFPHDYPDADTIVLLYFAGFRVREVPVRMFPSATGKSIHGGFIQPLYYIFKMLLSIFIFSISRREIEKWNKG